MRRIVKEIVIIVLSWLFRDRRRGVIFYHDIGKKYTRMGTPERLFKAHIDVISSINEENRPVVCFDDGFQGLWDHRDLLNRIKAKVIVFIAVGLVGKEGYLTWDEIKVLQDDYGVEFQSHTWSHQTLVGPMIDESPKAERNDNWFEQELLRSRIEIASRIGRDVSSLCFPAGYYSTGILKKALDAGYEKVYVSHPGRPFTYGDNEKMLVQTRCLAQDLSAFALRGALNGGMNLFEKHYKSRHVFD